MSKESLFHQYQGIGRWLCALIFGALITIPSQSFGQHIHELFYNNVNWVDTDLSALTGAARAESQGIAAFYTIPNDEFHVYYASGGDRHIHQLYFNGSAWSDSDLTALTGATIAFPGSAISGFSVNNFQYVYFGSPDGHIHEFSFVNNWVDTDLSALTATVGGSIASDGLVSFATTPNGHRHVYYQQSNKTIHQLLFDGSKWKDSNLTSATHGVRGNQSWMGGLAIGNSQYVFFEDAKGHIQEYFNITGWAAQDLTALAGSPNASTTFGNGVTAFLIPATKKMEVFYSEANSLDVHQLVSGNNTKWTDKDVTALSSGPGHGGEGAMVGFATTPNKQLHLYFGAVGAGHVNQLYFNGTAWTDQDLSTITGSTGMGGIGTPGMAGFALGNLQRVYYVDTN